MKTVKMERSLYHQVKNNIKRTALNGLLLASNVLDNFSDNYNQHKSNNDAVDKVNIRQSITLPEEHAAPVPNLVINLVKNRGAL
ncbi:TPA: DUF4765 family protein [Escherichia coli]|nr:DUF4765 family protein [Escherichia coli]EFF5453147.1 DUF4765 family protein [Escherichia coli]EFI8193016.1 DUF4765 family protein [Escherichia coli]EFJ5640466.1 DUF4765 family protein [Escherichia coli]EGM4558250.1 DUF4765 family protein [Escherichia coli]